MILLESICKTYKKSGGLIRALDDVSLSVPKGGFVSVVGPSGSGKTTLMNIIGCLDSPTSGRFCLGGREIHALSGGAAADVRNRDIGFIFQSFNLIPSMTALENTELPLVLRGEKRAERRELALDALAQVGLCGREGHRPSELSGGQQQRVAIARVLAARPNLILADEPTGNLDRDSGRDVIGVICALQRLGKTVIMITHDLTVAAAAPLVLRMENGQLFQN